MQIGPDRRLHLAESTLEVLNLIETDVQNDADGLHPLTPSGSLGALAALQVLRLTSTKGNQCGPEPQRHPRRYVLTEPVRRNEGPIAQLLDRQGKLLYRRLVEDAAVEQNHEALCLRRLRRDPIDHQKASDRQGDVQLLVQLARGSRCWRLVSLDNSARDLPSRLVGRLHQ